jgi:predicted ATPase/DNA-binding SARP family transcriptional activator
VDETVDEKQDFSKEFTENTWVLHLRLLGKVEITTGGIPLPPLRGKSGLWLLGVLTLQANHPVKRDWLAGILWPESAPELGKANLRRTLTDIRQALGEEATRLTSPTQHTILLHVAESEADVLMFRAGEFNQYGGELMPGCSVEWVENERRVLTEMFLTQGEKHAATLPPAAALVLLEQLRTADPLRESLLRLHLTVLCQQGNRVEAQQIYHTFRRLLLEKRLGEPSTQTQSHWAQVQNQQTIPAPATSQHISVTLPVPLTPLLGRRSEMETLARLLDQHRLVTLTGLGGIGKTRLAIELARGWGDALFVSLAEWQDATQFTETLETLLSQYSSNTAFLLLLDNFEQLISPEANLALRTQLEKNAQMRCLITSRRALGLTGEQLLPLEPLEQPQYPGSPELLGEFPSIQLLVERIRALNPQFELTAQNAPTLVALCQQAEGIPLALELLAAHLRSLSPEMLLSQVLRERLPLLARREPGETPRHQSLQRIIESSVSLLSEEQRTGFWKFGVFRGGWSLEAAQAVCTPLDLLSTISLLETLTDNALIRFTSGRYDQLETLRDFSLATQPETIFGQAQRDHAAYFLDFAEKHRDKPEDLSLFDTEHSNLRAAFETFLSDGDTASALRWTRALRLYWYHRGGVQALLERLLNCLNTPAERAELQDMLGVLCAMHGSYTEANSYFEQALEYFRDAGDRLTQAKILSNLAGMAIERGDYDQIRPSLEEALPLWRTLNQPRGLSVTLMNLGIVLTQQGELEEAESLLLEALPLREAQGDNFGIATCLVNRGAIELKRSANQKAQATYQEALQRFQKIGDRRGEASSLEGLVEVFLQQNQPTEALRYFQEVVWLRQEYKLPKTALQTELYARIRQALGEAAYDSLIAGASTGYLS